jgi:hypothetical protein
MRSVNSPSLLGSQDHMPGQSLDKGVMRVGKCYIAGGAGSPETLYSTHCALSDYHEEQLAKAKRSYQMRAMTIRGIATLSLATIVGMWTLIVIWVHKTGPEAVSRHNLDPNTPVYYWKCLLIAAIGGILVYGVNLLIRSSESWGAGSELPRLSIRIGLLIITGGVLVRLALILLSNSEVAAVDRDPNLAAAALAVGGAVLALWQIVNNFLDRRLWSNSIVVAILVYLDIFLLCFQLW